MALSLDGEPVSVESADETTWLTSDRLKTWTVVLNFADGRETWREAKQIHACELLLTDGGSLVFRTDERFPVMVYGPGSWFRVFPGDEEPDFETDVAVTKKLLQHGHERAQAVVRGETA